MLRDVLCDFVWDSNKLQRLPLPVDTATVDNLRWHFALPYWRHDGRPFQVTPAQVKADPARYQEHYQRTMARYDLKLWIGSGDGSAAYLPG